MNDTMSGGRRSPLLMLGAGIAALAVLAVAAIFVFFNFIRDDAPAAFELSDGTEQTEDDAAAPEEPEETTETTATTATTADGDATDETDAADTTDAEDSAPAPTEDGALSLDGAWTVGPGSEAGYRVVEDLGSIQDFEAVGRTDAVTGSIEIAGTTITSGSFEVNVAAITSDDERRDRAFQNDVMSVGNFPTATLALTEPIELETIPAPSTPISTTAVGELTLRDTTNPVTFPVDAQLLDGQIEIVASVDVLFTDYGIQNPSNPFVSVRDEGKVEVRLLLIPG